MCSLLGCAKKAQWALKLGRNFLGLPLLLWGSAQELFTGEWGWVNNAWFTDGGGCQVACTNQIYIFLSVIPISPSNI